MTKRRHKCTGEDLAGDLIAWVGSADSPRRRRVEEILELSQSIEETCESETNPDDDSAVARWHRALRENTIRLQALLSRYTFKLFVLPRGMGTLLKSAASDEDEAQAVLYIQQLRRVGLLSRVRRCATCGKWIFAKFRSQRFCSGSDSCRVKTYQSDADWRERHNAKRRRIYHLRKEKGYKIKTQQRDEGEL